MVLSVVCVYSAQCVYMCTSYMCTSTQAVVTRWGADPMSYGSYSSVKVGSLGAEDYRVVAEHVGGVVYFAGEATTDKYPATMHGAYLSGVREVGGIWGGLSRGEVEQMIVGGALCERAFVLSVVYWSFHTQCKHILTICIHPPHTHPTHTRKNRHAM